MAVRTKSTTVEEPKVLEQAGFSRHFLEVCVGGTQVVEQASSCREGTAAQVKCTVNHQGVSFSDGHDAVAKRQDTQDVSQVSSVRSHVRLQNGDVAVVALDQAQQDSVFVRTGRSFIRNRRFICSYAIGKGRQSCVRRAYISSEIAFNIVDCTIKCINITFPTAGRIQCDRNSLDVYVSKGGVSGTGIHFDLEMQTNG